MSGPLSMELMQLVITAAPVGETYIVVNYPQGQLLNSHQLI